MEIERLAKVLGYAGLVPFIVFSVGAWTGLPLVEDPQHVLSAYAAVILSFMGAIHWGIAMTTTRGDTQIWMGASVVPALLAWVALLLPVLYGLLLLMLCFIALCALDRQASALRLVPSWYWPMRVILTTVVAACLAAAALAHVVL